MMVNRSNTSQEQNEYAFILRVDIKLLRYTIIGQWKIGNMFFSRNYLYRSYLEDEVVEIAQQAD